MFTIAKKNAETTNAVATIEMSDADLAGVTGGSSVYNDNTGEVVYFNDGDGSVADRFASTYFTP